MWLVTLLVMIGQFVVIGFGIACVVFAIVEWFREDNPISN